MWLKEWKNWTGRERGKNNEVYSEGRFIRQIALKPWLSKSVFSASVCVRVLMCPCVCLCEKSMVRSSIFLSRLSWIRVGVKRWVQPDPQINTTVLLPLRFPPSLSLFSVSLFSPIFECLYPISFSQHFSVCSDCSYPELHWINKLYK